MPIAKLVTGEIGFPRQLLLRNRPRADRVIFPVKFPNKRISKIKRINRVPVSPLVHTELFPNPRRKKLGRNLFFEQGVVTALPFNASIEKDPLMNRRTFLTSA